MANLVTDDNLDDYISEAIGYWNGRLEAWRRLLERDPETAIVDDDEGFRIIAMRSVFNRIKLILETAEGKPRVELLREYAMSLVLAVAMNPSRTKCGARAILDTYKNAAWGQVLSDLRLPQENEEAAVITHKPF